MSDILQFTAHWSLIAVLMFFFIGTAAHLMGLIVVPRKLKIVAFVMFVFLVVITLLGALLR